MAKQKSEADKRRALRRKKIRRRRLLISFVVFLIIALITGVILSLTVLFPVTELKASGSKLYSEKQIVNASRITDEDNIFTFSRTKATNTMRKKLPYIDKVDYKIVLPDTVIIKVSDAVEYNAYKTADGYYTVSESGYVLSLSEEAPSNLFTVICEDAVKCKIGSKLEFTDSYVKKIVEDTIKNMDKKSIKINYIDASDTISIKAKVEDRFLVNFGTSNDIEKKIAHLSGMVKSISEERTGRIDLSMWSSQKTEGSFTECEIE